MGDPNIPTSTSEVERLPLIWIHSPPDSEDGILQLTDALQQVVPSEADLGMEATRLLEAGEYRAAVISAMSLLEDTLRRRLDKPGWSDVRRPLSMRQLIEISFPGGELPNAARLQEWIQLRNKAVHENARVTQSAANGVVNGVFKLLESLG